MAFSNSRTGAIEEQLGARAMKVTLTVVGGKHAGKIVPVTRPQVFHRPSAELPHAVHEQFD